MVKYIVTIIETIPFAMFKRQFVRTIDVNNPIEFCADKEKNALNELKRIYEGKCEFGCRIIEVTSIVKMSNCILVKNSIQTKSTINVTFIAKIDRISSGDILCPVEVVVKESLIIGVYIKDRTKPMSVESVDAVVQINPTPEIATIKIKQLIPVRVEQALHDYKDKNTKTSAVFLTANNNELPIYSLKPSKNSVYEDETIGELIRMIHAEEKRHKTLEEVESGSAGTLFFTDLYTGQRGSSAGVDLMKLYKEKKLPEEKTMICRSRKRMSNDVVIMNTIPEEKGNVVKEEYAIIIYRTLFADIFAYKRLLCDLLSTYNTKQMIKENSNIWLAINAATARQLMSTLMVGGDPIDGGKAGESKYLEAVGENYKFSSGVVDAGKKFQSKFPWGSFRIAKNTPQYSLMPWQMNSHNKAVMEIIGERLVSSILDATSHVGVDLVNLGHLFPKSRLIGIELNKDYCKLCKMNVNIAPNKSEVLCGNSIDVIEAGVYRDISFVYLDPPWGGPNYKKFSEIPLELKNGKDVLYDMPMMIDMIFAGDVSDTVILKVPNNYADTDKLALSYYATAHDVNNEMDDGKFGKVSYRLMGIKKKKDVAIPSPVSGKQYSFVAEHTPRYLKKLIEKHTGGKFNSINSIHPELVISGDEDFYKEMCLLITTAGAHDFGKSRGRKRYDEIKEFFPEKLSGKYVDMGAGAGEITEIIAQETKLETYAVDITETKAASNVITHKVVGENEKLPFDDNSVGLITAFQSLHHFRDLKLKLAEITRIAAPGSIFVVREHDTPNDSKLRPFLDVEHLVYMIGYESMTYSNAVKSYYAHYRSKYEWIQMISGYGWNLLHIVNKGPDYFYACFSRKA